MSTMTTPTPWGQTPEQMLTHWQSFLRKAMPAPKVAQVMQRVRVGATPARPVMRADNVRLLCYESEVEKRYRTPLLLVFALVNRPYILDLRPGKSVVSHFLGHGFDVYNLDWGVPGLGDRHLGLKDYVRRYLDGAVEHIRRRCGCPRISLLGYCMGGTMAAIYTALHQEKIENLMLLAAPIDWSHRENLLSVWADERYFDVDRLIEVYGNAPPQWLQASFQLLRPVQNLLEKYVNFYENIDNERFLEDFFAMETWLNDNIPVAGEVFREFVKYMFQQNRLIEGRLEVGGQRVDLRRITCPILNLIAENDHLVPPNQSLSFNGAVCSKDRRTITFPAGHIGMAVGGRSHRELWPKVCDWLAERSESLKGRRAGGVNRGK
jgi:polyhydroxyalkanoate synthase